MNRKIAAILIAGVMIMTVFAGCGGKNSDSNETNQKDYGTNFRTDMMIPEEGYLHGLCYLYMERRDQADYHAVLRAMNNLGVKSLRTWMHFSYFMSDPDTLIDSQVDAMKEYLSEAEKYGFQIIGMNHYNNDPKGGFRIGKQRRIFADRKDSDYRLWLKDYEKSWYTLVSTFPEIKYWEIDNELNNPDFMYIDGDRDNAMSQEDMAAVALDMMFYASRAIHRANPDAVTVMGGLVEMWGLGKGNSWNGTYVGDIPSFLEILYDYIESGEFGSIYPDDFFQVAAWHPYYYEKGPDDDFVRLNNEIYEIIKRREGKDKKVFLTEFGWFENHTSLENITAWIPQLYECIHDEMPYVESLHYFILFNRRDDSPWQNYGGLYYDPRESSQDYILSTGEIAVGQPKSSAYAYQRSAGGSGDITIIDKENK